MRQDDMLTQRQPNYIKQEEVKGSPPILVILFFNLALLVLLAILFGHYIILECVSPMGVGISLALITLEFFHLVCRYLADTHMGSVKIGIFEFEQLGKHLIKLHPPRKMLPDRVLWPQALVIILVAALFGVPVTSPFRNSEPAPDVQSFLVHTDDHSETYAPDDLLQIAKDSTIHVEARTLDQSNISCTWSSYMGTLLPMEGCAIKYSPSVEWERDILSVQVKSPCGAYQKFANLHIEIVQAEP